MCPLGRGPAKPVCRSDVRLSQFTSPVLQSIETSRDDAHRAAAYSKRGSAYSEQARYSRASKLISSDEYGRLFRLAIQDQDQAIALDPSNAEALNSLGKRRVANAYCLRGDYDQKEKRRSMTPPSRIMRKQSFWARPPTTGRAIPTIRCSDSTLGAGDSTRPGTSSTLRSGPGNGSSPNSWIS